MTHRTSESAILKQYVAEREKVRVLCSEIDKKDAVIRVLKLHLRKDRVGIDWQKWRLGSAQCLRNHGYIQRLHARLNWFSEEMRIASERVKREGGGARKDEENDGRKFYGKREKMRWWVEGLGWASTRDEEVHPHWKPNAGRHLYCHSGMAECWLGCGNHSQEHRLHTRERGKHTAWSHLHVSEHQNPSRSLRGKHCSTSW